MKPAAGRIVWRKSSWFGVLFYGFCPDEEAWSRVRQKTLSEVHVDIGAYPETSGNVTAWVDRLGNARHLMTISDALDDDPVELIGTLAHESWHIASAIFEGMSEDRSGEEVQAYVLGGITSEMFSDYSQVRSPLARQANTKD